MIAVECPQCGAATPAFPLTPDRVSCRACRYDGPPKPEVVAQLRDAGARLGAASAHEARQVGAVHAAGVLSLLHNRTRLHRLLWVLLLPFGLLGTCTVFATVIDDPNYTLALICAVPLLLFGAAMLFGSRYLDAQARKLATAIGAIPPATPGAPAQCHLCGASLPPATNESPIARCRHCGTDNVASPELLDDIVKRRRTTIGAFERDLAGQASNMAIRSASAVTLVFILGIAAPFAGCLGAFALESALDDVAMEQLASEYVFTTVHDRVCAALVTEKKRDGTWTLYSPYGDTVIQSVPGAARYTRVDQKWFVRQRMQTSYGESATKGTVTAVRPHVLRPRRNQGRLRLENGKREMRALEGLCFIDPPPNVTTYPWPEKPLEAPVASASSAPDDAGSSSAPRASGSAPLAPGSTSPKGRPR